MVRETLLQCLGNCAVLARRALLPQCTVWEVEGGESQSQCSVWTLLKALAEEQGGGLGRKVLLLLTGVLAPEVLGSSCGGGDSEAALLALCHAAAGGLGGRSSSSSSAGGEEEGEREGEGADLASQHAALALLASACVRAHCGNTRSLAPAWAAAVGALATSCASAALAQRQAAPNASLLLAGACAQLGQWGVECSTASALFPVAGLLAHATLLLKRACGRGEGVGDSPSPTAPPSTAHTPPRLSSSPLHSNRPSACLMLALAPLSSSLARCFVLSIAALPGRLPALTPGTEALIEMENFCARVRGEGGDREATSGLGVQSRALLRALTAGLGQEANTPHALLALAARATAVLGSASGSPAQGSGEEEDLRQAFSAMYSASIACSGAMLQHQLHQLHAQPPAAAAAASELGGEQVLAALWPALHLAFTLLTCPHPPLPPHTLAATLHATLLTPALGLLEGVCAAAAAQGAEGSTSHLLLRSSLVELLALALKHLHEPLTLEASFARGLLACGLRELSRSGGRGGAEMASLALARAPPLEINWRELAGEGSFAALAAGLALGVESAAASASAAAAAAAASAPPPEFLAALQLCHDLLALVHRDVCLGAALVDLEALARLDAAEAEGLGSSALCSVSRREALESLLTYMTPLAPFCALLAALAAPPLGPTASLVLWDITRLSPLQTGFELLEWTPLNSPLCAALGSALLPQREVEACMAPSQAPLSSLVRAAAAEGARGGSGEGGAAQKTLWAVCKVSGDAHAWASRCEQWGAVEPLLPRV